MYIESIGTRKLTPKKAGINLIRIGEPRMTGDGVPFAVSFAVGVPSSEVSLCRGCTVSACPT